MSKTHFGNLSIFLLYHWDQETTAKTDEFSIFYKNENKQLPRAHRINQAKKPKTQIACNYRQAGQHDIAEIKAGGIKIERLTSRKVITRNSRPVLGPGHSLACRYCDTAE